MPPNYVAPGVFVQELPTQVRAIETLPTDVTAFVGAARKGGTYRAYAVKSFGEFTARFGALKTNLELGYAVSQFFVNGGVTAWVVRVAQKSTIAQWQRGLRALDKVEVINLLVLPGAENPAVCAAALSYAQSRRAFLLLDSPRLATSAAAMRDASPSLPVNADAAVYFPWIQISDPANRSSDALRLSAPTGSVAGVMGRVDAQRGVWKSPAGNEAVIKGALGLAVRIGDQEGNDLNALAVNCLREFPGYGRIVYGARTLAGGNASGSEWKYVPVRRLGLLLESSLERGLQWAVFEPAGEPLWVQIRLNSDSFMNQFFRLGAFQGNTPSQAYFVKCDAGTTTAADIVAGITNVVIGFAPLKPAEFVVIKLTLRMQAK